MPVILEELKARLVNAQSRQLLAQAKHQAASAELNAANLNVNVWSNAVNIEAAEEAQKAAEAARDQIRINLPEASVVNEPEALEEIEEIEDLDEEPVNKTETVRELLRANPRGISPGAIWTAFHAAAPRASRNYLYSVLKRLRDKDEVTQRRGKYVLKIKPASETISVTEDERFVGGSPIVY